MARLFTGYISEDDCMGDSLGPEGGGNKGTINENSLALDEAVQSLSAYDNSLRQAITPISNNLTVTNDLTATGSITTLNEVRTNIIRSTTGVTHFINGYPRQPGQIIECLTGLCDGRTLTSINGNVVLSNVTSTQSLVGVGSYIDVTGSSITYTPPTGTRNVRYSFSFQYGTEDSWGITHFRFYTDTTEMSAFRRTLGTNSYPELAVTLEAIINLEANNINNGQITSWTTPKTLKWQARPYSSSYEAKIHSPYHWDGGNAGTMFMPPTITIMAIA